MPLRLIAGVVAVGGGRGGVPRLAGGPLEQRLPADPSTREHLDDGRGLYFVGAIGTGKTTLAMLVSSAPVTLKYPTDPQ